jgi:hypothetical protein
VKAYWGSGGIAPGIVDLGTRWRSVVSFTLRPLYLQGKSPWYPLDRRLGGSQSRPGHGGEEKNSQPLLGLEPSIIQPVAHRYITELSRTVNMVKVKVSMSPVLQEQTMKTYWRLKLHVFLTLVPIPIFHCIDRSERSVQVRTPVLLRRGVVCPTSNTQT